MKCQSLEFGCSGQLQASVTPEVAGSSPVILASKSCVRVDTEMDEILTIDEIKAHCADWVLIGEPETDEALEFRAGRVLFQGWIETRSVARPWNTHPDGTPCNSWNDPRGPSARPMSFSFDPSHGPILVKAEVTGPVRSLALD